MKGRITRISSKQRTNGATDLKQLRESQIYPVTLCVLCVKAFELLAARNRPPPTDPSQQATATSSIPRPPSTSPGGWPTLNLTAGITTTEAAPPFVVFEGACPERSRRVGTADDDTRAWRSMPQLSCGFHGVVVRSKGEVKAGGAHLSKTTIGGAASSLVEQRWASPPEKEIRFVDHLSPLGMTRGMKESIVGFGGSRAKFLLRSYGIPTAGEKNGASPVCPRISKASIAASVHKTSVKILRLVYTRSTLGFSPK